MIGPEGVSDLRVCNSYPSKVRLQPPEPRFTSVLVTNILRVVCGFGACVCGLCVDLVRVCGFRLVFRMAGCAGDDHLVAWQVLRSAQ